MFQLQLLENETLDTIENDQLDTYIAEASLHDIAIIGISAKLPLSATYDQFWERLQQGVDAVGPFPDSRRLQMKAYLNKLRVNEDQVVFFEGAYLDDVSEFDYAFFRLSPHEAALMSPNQRMFLQTAWRAIEDAGYGGDGLRDTRTGVFVGHNADTLHDYKRVLETLSPQSLSLAAAGNLSPMIASRISYLLNFRGPSLSIDTACSSSLVAIHLACQSLRSGECDTAIAGSVKLNLLPMDTGIRLGIEASDYRAKPFDESADGTGIGEGVVAFILKPLHKAEQDNDNIYAVIKGSAMNQDGASVGITAPNAVAQEDVIIRAWQDAGINPETVSYMEAHGTGTALGDPIEIEGMTRAFRRYTEKRQLCAIGSVKSNVGHLDHAAGMVGMLKAVLALRARQLPATLHFQQPNRSLSLTESPLYVNDRLSAWKPHEEYADTPLRCGVSAFGMSGTNCHVVLEEAARLDVFENQLAYQANADRSATQLAGALNDGRLQLFTLSAQTKAALKRMAVEYVQRIAAAPANWSLADVCYTAHTGRGHYACRLAILARNLNELVDKLRFASEESDFIDKMMLGEQIYPSSLSSAARTTGMETSPMLGQMHSTYDEAITDGIYGGRVSEFPFAEAMEHNSASSCQRLTVDTLIDVNPDWLNDNQLVQKLAQSYIQGAYISWDRLYSNEVHRKLPLPGYSFEPTRCWVEPAAVSSWDSLFLTGDPGQETELPPELAVEMKTILADWRRRYETWLSTRQHEVPHVRLIASRSLTDSKDDSVQVLTMGEDYSSLEQQIADWWGDTLGYEELELNRSFFELGGDSIMALKVMNLIYGKWQIKLEAAQLFASPTIKELASLVAERIHAESYQDEPIPRLPKQETYVVSPAQRRLYLQQQAVPADKSYNLPETLRLEGALDVIKLEQALQTLIARHEMLRASFLIENGEIRQRISDHVPFHLPLIEASELELPALLKLHHTPFQLEHAPLLRAALFQIAELEYVLFLDMHHIVSDGTSTGLLIKEMMTLYTDGELVEPSVSYRDYAAWQLERCRTEDMEEHRQFWLREGLMDMPVLELPTDFARPPVKSNAGETFDVYVSTELTAKLHQLAQAQHCTLFPILLSAYYTLLANYSGQTDIAVGTPIAGRSRTELESVVGMFVNTVVIRSYPQADKTYLDYVKEVQNTILACMHHQDYPFEELVLGHERFDPSRSPLFDTMFVMQNLDIPELKLGEVRCIHQRYDHRTAKYDLMIQAVERSEQLRFVVEYSAALFRQETIQTMMSRYVYLLEQMVEEPHLTLGSYRMLTAEEELKLRTSVCSNTAPSFGEIEAIHRRMERMTQFYPDHIAVECGADQLSYKEVNEQANRLARVLRTNGVSSGTIVAVMAERSVKLMVGLLAVLKAGGAYMPIDPSNPADRKLYMLQDSGASVLLIDGDNQTLPFAGISIDLNSEQWLEGDGSNLDLAIEADELMYVIYTSGSTGRPKGVMITHHNFFNFAHSMNLLYENTITSKDRFLSLTNLSFDVSVCEMFTPLMFGATLVFYPDSGVLDVRSIARCIGGSAITFAYLPPTLLDELAVLLEKQSESLQLNKLLVGVEPIKDSTLAKFKQLNPDMRIINGYGPTESTVCSNMYVFQDHKVEGRNVPIGKPMHNVEVYLLGYGNKIVPAGITGELCIAGAGLARGYWNKPELTAERFVYHPSFQGKTLYRTGDLAKWLPDGNAVFIGRIDHQVKIRGYRIELGEIEVHLSEYEGIRQVLAVTREEEQGLKYICAYIVGDPDISGLTLRKYLAARLPEYMIPSYFVSLPAIPLTANGKVDRRALPEPDKLAALSETRVKPRTEKEMMVAQLFRDILGIPDAGIHEHFFELGGHSLKATMLVSRLSELFEEEIPVSVVFERPTVAELAQYLEDRQLERRENTDLDPTRVRAEQAELASEVKMSTVRANRYPTTAAQHRLYLLDQLHNDSVAYNMPAAVEVVGNLDYKALAAALQGLVDRHESLRTSFAADQDKSVQVVHEQASIVLTERQAAFGEEMKIMDEFVRPFDLATYPLIRVELVTLVKQEAGSDQQQTKNMLLFDMHHIISDGFSMAVLMKDLTALYAGLSLAPLSIQMKDVAVWQERQLQGPVMQEQERYWLDVFQGELPVLKLPVDYKRPELQSYEGSQLLFEVDRELSARIRKSAKTCGVTLYTYLLAGYFALLSRYSGQEDIVVGTPVAGRTQIQMEQIVGMMVNTVAIRSEANPELTIKEYVSRLQRRVIEAMERQHYPFERLVDKLFTARDTSRNPLFDTMFIMQNMDKAELKAAGVHFKPIRLEQQMSKFDLTLEAAEDNHILRFHLEYATRLFEPATAARMARHYVKLLAEMAADPHRQLKELDLLAADELDMLLASNHKANDGALPVTERITNGTSSSDNRMKRVYQLIEEQAAKTPQATAIICEGESVTYNELNERATQLAYTLRQRGVGQGSIVALLAGRSSKLLIGLLAILKAGGAYVAIDPSFPRERIELMLEDCGTKFVLTERAYAGSLQAAEEWLLDDPNMYADHILAAQLKQVNDEHDLAYILYTSGSTGRPKGVMIEHKGLSHFIDGFAQRFEMVAGQAILGLATVSFDIFIVETLLPLTLGMKIVFANDEEKSDTARLSELIRKHHVQVLQTTPSRTKWWVAQSGDLSAWQDLQILMIGAEPLSRHLLSELQSSTKARIYNLYGPTETTVWTAVQDVTNVGRGYDEQAQSRLLQVGEFTDKQSIQPHHEPATEITIGTPIAGAEMLVLDADGRLQPIGVLGEIHIGGDGLGRGYIAHEDWTMQAFVEHPYRQGEKLYRTGDIGRRLSNGQFAFAGRRDHQVKIRGHRIELGEIEHQLLALQYVKDAVIHVWSAQQNAGDVDECELCAYLVCSEEVTTAQLRQGLQRKLPEYMVPTYYVKLDAIPLTPTGKVDRKALPQPGQADIAGERIYAELTSETEKSLALIWQEVLNLDRIGADDHFFDQGGHSLKAAMLVNRVREQFGVNLQLSEVFQYPTLSEMASRIDTLEPESFWEGQQQNPFADLLEPIQPIAAHDYMPVQESQMWSAGTVKQDGSTHLQMNAASAMQSVAAAHADEAVTANLAAEQQRFVACDSAAPTQVQEQTTILAESTKSHPLSSAQKRQFILQHLGGDTTAYHLPIVVAIEGEVDSSRLEQALNSLIERQPSLRTTFDMVDGEPVQRVAPFVSFKLDEAVVEEETLYNELGWDDVALNDLMNTFIRPFDLLEAPLMRVRLVTLLQKKALTEAHIVSSDNQAQARSNKRHLLLIDMHHIISDGTSLIILVRELAALYGQHQLVPLALSYTDYASVQQQTRASDKYKQAENYWLSTMDGELPVLELPTDFPRPPLKSNAGRCHYFHLDAELTSAVKQLARAEGTTLYTVMLTAYTTLLHRLTGQDDIIVGTPVAGRDRSELEHIIGMFVSTVLIRSKIDSSERIRHRIHRLHGELMQAFEHQAYPFEDLVDKLSWNRDPGRNPLFDTLFVLQNMDGPQMSTSQVSFRPLPFDRHASQFDLTFEAIEAAQDIRIRFEYATALFKPDTIERMAEQYKYILQQMTNDPDNDWDALRLLDDKQQQIMLAKWDLITSTDLRSTAKPVYRLFEQQAALTPSRTAICHEGTEVTYRELDDRATQLAVKLRKLGVGPERIVGILMGRSPALVTAILAIHKAGGAYMPIDPAYPQERIQYMLLDSGTMLVLTDHTTVEITGGWGEQLGNKRSAIHSGPNLTIEQQASGAEGGWNGLLLDVELWLQELNKYGAVESSDSSSNSSGGDVCRVINADEYDSSSLHAVECADELSRLAYVIYTSGSTGKPKGVMVEQRGLSHYIAWARGAYVKQAEETFALYSSIAFDLTITSLFVPLTGGHRLVIYGDELTIDVILRRIMTERQVTIVKLTPAHLTLLPDMDITTSAVHSFIVGGEELSASIAARISKSWPIPLAIYNEYGPTETVVGCMLHQFDEQTDTGFGVPIGKPIVNTAIYVLDASRRLVPPGVIGEIYIGGAGVARGYWQRDKLTSERFVLNPFRSNERMYRTGDLARINSHGLMEYVGRVDHQVKINGYRIELGEIEACVTAYPIINQAVVVNRSDSGGQMLCCYYSIRSEHAVEAPAMNEDGASLREEELRSYLAASLPVYMVPAHLIELPALPLTQSGKVDRQALPKPVLTIDQDDTGSYIPTTDAEATLVGIWREVLGIGQVGLRDNFFRAGGNSLLLIQVYQKLNRLYPELLRVTDLFAYPTIRDLAEQITLRQADSSAIGEDAVILLNKMVLERAGAYEETTLQAKVNRNVQPEWFARNNETADQNERWFQGVMAAYAYALYEASEGEYVPIHYVTAARGAESRAVVVPINMNAVSDIPEYVEHVLQTYANVRTRVQSDSYAMRNLMKDSTHQVRNAVYPLLAEARRWEGSGSWLRKYGVLLVVDKQEAEITLSLTFDAGLLEGEKMRELLQMIVQLMNQLRHVTPDVGVISH